VLPETPINSAEVRANEIRVAFSDLSSSVLPGGDNGATASVSGGVAACPNHGLTEDAVIRSVDEAMYAAKKAGRNQVHVAEAKHTTG